MEDATTIALMVRKGWRRVRGGSWTSLQLNAMPLPLARAFSIRPPLQELPDEEPSSFDYMNHAVHLQERQGKWQARVTGPLALRSCPSKGVKTFCAEGREQAKEAAERWLDSFSSSEPGAVGFVEGEEVPPAEVGEWFDSFAFQGRF